jgi:urease subunit alpha
MAELSREEYTRRYGPTTGDRVRLGDTDLWIRVEDDHVGYGDEPIWGYAKTFRSRMTQFDRATPESELDMLIAGVLVVDPFLGVVKTNIGIKGGGIAAINCTVQLTVTTFDGRTASTSQVVHVRTHDVAIDRFLAPMVGSAGQTGKITVGIGIHLFPEDIQVQLFRGIPGGFVP